MRTIFFIFILVLSTSYSCNQTKSSASNEEQSENDTTAIAVAVHQSDSTLENISAVSGFLWKRTLDIEEVSPDCYSKTDSFYLAYYNRRITRIQKRDLFINNCPPISVFIPFDQDYNWPSKAISLYQLGLSSRDTDYLKNDPFIKIGYQVFPLNAAQLVKLGDLDEGMAPGAMVDWPKVYTAHSRSRKYLFFDFGPLNCNGTGCRAKWIYVFDITDTSHIHYLGFNDDAFFSVESFDDRNNNGFPDIEIPMRWVNCDTTKYVCAERMNYFDIVKEKLLPLKNAASDSVFTDVAFPISNYPPDIARDSCVLVKTNK